MRKSDQNSLVEYVNGVVDRCENGINPFYNPLVHGSDVFNARRANGARLSPTNTSIAYLELMSLTEKLGNRDRVSSYWMTIEQAAKYDGYLADKSGTKIYPDQARSAKLWKPNIVAKDYERLNLHELKLVAEEDRSVKYNETTNKYEFFRGFGTYHAYNACQFDGLPDHFLGQAHDPNVPLDEKISKLENKIKDFGIEIDDTIKGEGRFDIKEKKIYIRASHRFNSPEEYANTLANEFMQAMDSSIGFNNTNTDSNKAVSKLIAELGAGMILSELDIPMEERLSSSKAASLLSWLEEIEESPKLLLAIARNCGSTVIAMNNTDPFLNNIIKELPQAGKSLVNFARISTNDPYEARKYLKNVTGLSGDMKLNLKCSKQFLSHVAKNGKKTLEYEKGNLNKKNILASVKKLAKVIPKFEEIYPHQVSKSTMIDPIMFKDKEAKVVDAKPKKEPSVKTEEVNPSVPSPSLDM